MAYHQTLIVGNLGQDPESRYLPNGDAVCNFSVAVTESWKDKHGEKQERTTWYRVNAFRRLAEICGQYLNKGSQVMIVGQMQSRDWEDKDGVKRTAWELRAETMQMLGQKQEGQHKERNDSARNEQQQSAPRKPQQNSNPGDFEEDIPF